MDGFGTEEWCMETTYSDGDLFSATICFCVSQPRFADLDFFKYKINFDNLISIIFGILYAL